MKFYEYTINYYTGDGEIYSEKGLTFGDCYSCALENVLEDFGLDEDELQINSIRLELVYSEGDYTLSYDEFEMFVSEKMKSKEED